MRTRLLPAVCALAVAAGAFADSQRILVFSKTAGFRHASIPDGIEAMKKLGKKHDIAVEATEDSAKFTEENLKRFDAVVFLSTTGDVLNDAQQGAFEKYIKGGGAFVGIHAASDTEYDWPWYGKLVGAYFKSHPQIQQAVNIVEDRKHPSTEHLPERWSRTDEWYNYRDTPRGRVHVLMRLDETTYEGGGMPKDHPIAWCHEFEGGRAWYTGGGHTKESFTEEKFLKHMLGGIEWAIGRKKADTGATIEENFDKVVLDDDVIDPMELAIANDGRVFFVERAGVIKVWSPESRATRAVGVLDVFDELEDGLLGITLDPHFDDNGWVYLYYSPAGDEPHNVLSRFTFTEGALDMGTEVEVLDVRTQRDECCHSGGSLAFDADGNLYLSTGDNTSPFASDGFAPIDERPGRAPFDAQKSSANTHDLRGKILRITPRADGTYAIPEGNLFARDGSEGRPEIYIMGCRNPFRIGVDSRAGWIYWGEVGPDAGGPREGRGPAGHDEFNRANRAGNFGWPYFIADNRRYHDYDFETGSEGGAYDPARPVNQSPNNSGAEVLPLAQPAWIAYPYTEDPLLGSGERCAMGGPTYYVDDIDPARRSPQALPDYYDGVLFLYEWSRDWIKTVRFDESREILSMLPFIENQTLQRPMDLEIGPDGCLYLIEWGTGFGGGNNNSLIARIEHYPSGQRPPRAGAVVSADAGLTPLTIDFRADVHSAGTSGKTLRYAWDFDGDGATDSSSARATHRYTDPGAYTARLTVTDVNGLASVSNVNVVAGNARPQVAIEWPVNGGVAAFGDVVEFRTSVRDEADAPDPSRLVTRTALGHDTHAHPLRQHGGPLGQFETLRDGGHGADADLFTVVAATYADTGAPGSTPLTGRTEIILQPQRKQVEHFSAEVGTRTEKSEDPDGGGQSVVFDGSGDAIVIDPLNLHGIDEVTVRVSTGRGAAALSLRQNGPTGRELGRIDVEPTGGIPLSAVATPIRIEYFENTGGAGLILRVAGPNHDRQVVPADWLTQDGTTPGLVAEYYALDGPAFHGAPNLLPDFADLEPYARAATTTIDHPSTGDEFAASGRSDRVGAVFTGMLTVPVAGRYTFWLESDDGSRLFVNGELVVSNDGLHGMIDKRSHDGWRSVTVPIVDPGETFRLFVVREPMLPGRTGRTTDSMLRLNWIEFHGMGVAAERPEGASPDRHAH